MNPFAYPAFQVLSDLMLPVRHGAALMNHSLAAWQAFAETPQGRSLRATCDLLTLSGLTHSRPPFEIDSVDVDGKPVPIIEEVAASTPFCSLVHFAKDTARNGSDHAQPRVLVIAPMSGHFATLLRGTVRTMLAHHDVYITDWHNPRDISLTHGRFGFDEYVQHIIDFIQKIGPGAHLLAVCQPTVAALAAVALMAADNDPAQPASITLMAGPIDTRINPTRVNELAKSKPLEWFEKHLISAVPFGFAGAHRRVYPGFMQLNAFMAMNLSRHLDSFADMHYQRAKGDEHLADAIRVFYEEYFATMDLTADFYLETVDTVFQRHSLPLHELEVRGRKVEPSAIRRTALLTIEGERDDICAVGQTLAAQDLCDKLRPYLKAHHVQTGVGHYGVFNGRRWERQIYPRVRALIHDNEASPINVNARSQPIVPLQSIPPITSAAAESVLNEPGKTGKAGAAPKRTRRRESIAPEHMIDPQALADDVPGTQAVETDGEGDRSTSPSA
ncbi:MULTISPECIES: polyhydroxyalkanoate depolymerase [unclassified Caballeronia]|uniref:polyhydroxyalkanoate depolymerase n=1 Tax=unclassified Caballeronia TaxID=2646786 RepID=UPI00285AA4C4|nr:MULTISPECIES: polyhydroxyalkanoate depolymerase [unclassified Caballeronia]MDR5753139.1 polyhydroxyalkanoate depolymerase [Caballeronia sp. LZ024]MDR5842022.1 polyhydroxyalkanoate depolymerase [Caballeronia sp. LZ031]